MFPQTILFYSPADPYGYFSNFSRHSVILDRKQWKTSEAYFQAMKSTDPAVRERIRHMDSPGKAARIGRATRLRPDWELPLALSTVPQDWGIPEDPGPIELFKDLVMFRAVYAKFTQHLDLRAYLIETGNAVLIEDAVADPYWGQGCSKNGLNKLGKILMHVRGLLQAG